MYKKEPLEINYIVIVREVIYNTYIVKVREPFQVSRRLNHIAQEVTLCL